MSDLQARSLAILGALVAVSLAAVAGCLIGSAFCRLRQATTRRRGLLLWFAERSRTFWIVGAALPMAYLVSFGPACWISNRVQPGGEFVNAAYPQLVWIMWHRSGVGYESLLWRYVTVGHAADCGVGLDAHGRPRIHFSDNTPELN